MNYSELQETKEKFQPTEVEKSRANLYALRREFVRKFTPDKIRCMKLDEYIEGKGSTDSFCYWVERKLDLLGRIRGSFSTMFGVYFDIDDNDYWYAQKYGNDLQSAFRRIKQEILSLLKAGNDGDLSAIENNLLPPMFKGKILFLYFPDKYLNIYSTDHLKHYLRVLDLDTEALVKKDAVYLREELVRFKNSDSDMKNWSLDVFGHFLYTYYPPIIEKVTTIKKGKKSTVSRVKEEFPTTDDYEYVDLDIDFASVSDPTFHRNKGIAKKVDYEKQAKEYRKKGDRGEKIVMNAEIHRVMEECHLPEAVAKKKVIQRSRKSDSYGYDILSLNPDGSERYIEVKATAGKVGDLDFYYTQNEFETAQEYKDNYYIYIVFDIQSRKPKIWRIQNPFEQGDLEMKPVQYKISINIIK